MEMYSVEIVNPKAVKLLQDLADMELIVLKPVSSSSKQATEEEKRRAREAVMRGSSTMQVEAMLEHLRESRQDRKMPFREGE
jgi:DNA-binding GntR family transcriptional regulator